MVKVELSYNPYLLETEFLFNGQRPMVNSQVEKYGTVRIQDWLSTLPEILYDEMNGFDFDLNFSGTEIDFEYLKDIFQDKGIDVSDVRFHLVNSMEPVVKKIKRLKEFEKWLSENKNRQFDAEELIQRNPELYDYTGIMLSIFSNISETIELDECKVAIDSIAEEGDFPENLNNIPILFFIDYTEEHEFLRMLTYVLKREDVKPSQLFFLLSNQSLMARWSRILQDIGIAQPQFLKELTDKSLLDYIQIYSMNQFVYNNLQILTNEFSMLSQRLTDLEQESQLQNKEVLKMIDQLDKQIEQIKLSLAGLEDVHLVDFGKEVNGIKQELLGGIQKWLNQKSKFQKDVEAQKQAVLYRNELEKLYEKFILNVEKEYYVNVYQLKEQLQEAYGLSQLSEMQLPEGVVVSNLNKATI